MRDGEYRVVVFCASRPGEERQEELYGLAARFGTALAADGFVCVNGGSCGMMHHVSRGAFQAGGRVYCVGHATWKFDHEFYTECELLPSLRVRQGRLIELGHGFVALPGGVGTDYEIHEVLCSILAGEISRGTPLICVGRDDFADLEMRIGNHVRQGRVSGYTDPIDLITFVDTVEDAIEILKTHREKR